MSMLKEKTILITGGSRGIGLAIGLRFATAGANIVIAAKEESTSIQNAVDQMIEAGGQALGLDIDVCCAEEINWAVDQASAHFGGIDVLVNNTSAFCFTDTLNTSPEQFDLLISTNVRATFLASQACIPYLKLSDNPHIMNLGPPLHMDAHWFKHHLAFSISKYGMSLCTLGMAEEFKQFGIAVNSLWPQTTIATTTIRDHFSPQVYAGSRWPAIMADAAYELVQRPSGECTGQFFTDEALLRETGVVDFSHYAVDKDVPLMQSLFLPKEDRMDSISKDMFL